MTLLIGSSLYANENVCKHRILFVPQKHKSVIPDQSGAYGQFSEEVSKSQFKIAKYIEKNSNLPVFSEQIDTNISLRDLSSEQLQKVASEVLKNTFNSGLPQSYSDLTLDEKRRLFSSGGDLVQLLLGKIDTLYKVVPNREVQDVIFKEVTDSLIKNPIAESDSGFFSKDSEVYKLIYDKRERLALNEINNYFDKNPHQKEVILIYGGAHDFSRYPELFPSECVIVPDGFQGDQIRAVILPITQSSEISQDSSKSKNDSN